MTDAYRVTDAHRALRESLGAFVVGGLPPVNTMPWRLTWKTVPSAVGKQPS